MNFQLELIEITLHKNALERIIAAFRTFTKLSFGTADWDCPLYTEGMGMNP